MMKIKWLQHPNNPNLNGTTAHVPRELAIVAVGYGQAEVIRFANAGERLKSLSEETAPAPIVAHTDFSVNAGSASGEVYILGRCSNPSCGLIRYSGPPTKFNTPSTHGQKSRVFDPAVEVVIAHACGKGAEKITADIWKRYAAAKTEEKQFITPDQAAFYKMQNYVGQDNKHREVK